MNQEIDATRLDHLLDKTKSEVFIGNNAAFLGSLMGNLNFIWDDETATASIGNNELRWNPKWFESLIKETRRTVLIHELWHPALLHMLRRGHRDPKIWNYACDIYINNKLEDEGYSFVGVEWAWKDQQYKGMAEEDIYDMLVQGSIQIPSMGSWGDVDTGEGDLDGEMTDVDKHTAINNVVRAVQQAKMSNQAGKIPGHVQEIINRFLTPKINWKSMLMNFFTDLIEEDYSWRRPNRRHEDIYLPSINKEEGRLDHLIYFLDVSGSVSSKDILRFNSEVKFIKDTLNPVKLTLVQFDTRITGETVFNEGDSFEELVVTGRGGTSYVPVKRYIEKHNPTAAIIFTDLDCEPMVPPSTHTPIIWVAVNARNHPVKCGKVIHIKE